VTPCLIQEHRKWWTDEGLCTQCVNARIRAEAKAEGAAEERVAIIQAAKSKVRFFHRHPHHGFAEERAADALTRFIALIQARGAKEGT
jgi:hypothetical protein